MQVRDIIENYREKHQLSVTDCARLIGISMQTLYNIKEGKSVKPLTMNRVESWVKSINKEPNIIQMQQAMNLFHEQFDRYQQLLMETWTKRMREMTAEENQAMLCMIEELKNIQTQIQAYHEEARKWM